MLIFYRILTYLLLPVAGLFGMSTLFLLMSALGNVAALLPAFLTGATVLYIFYSFRFLQSGILPGKPVKASMRDWIRVNAFVALFYGSLFLVNGILLRNNQELIDQVNAQIDTMRDQMPELAKEEIDVSKILRTALLIMTILGSMLVGHVLLTFGYLRQYAHLLGGTPPQQGDAL